MFTVGSKVRAFGVDGVVIHHEGLDADYPVIVDFGNAPVISFALDGKYCNWHKEPSLVLVERAEKFEEVVGYVAVYESLEPISIISIGSVIYETKEEALAQPKAVGYREIKYFRKVKS